MDMFSLWERILSYVEKNDHQYYDMFLSQLSPCSFAGGVFTIAANKPFLIPWIKNLYAPKIESIIAGATGVPAVVQIILNPNSPPEAQAQPAPAVPEPVSVPAPSAPEPPVPPVMPAAPASQSPMTMAEETAPFPESAPAEPKQAPMPSMPIDVKNLRPKSLDEIELPSITDKIRESRKSSGPEMSLFPQTAEPEAEERPQEVKNNNTFDNFVFGNCNRMAYEAALAVANQVASGDYNRSFNPLFLYGPSGLGKTHLLHAIQNFLASSPSKKKAVFMPCETFFNELILAIKSKTQENFRKKYRTVDILLLDDVQFLGGRDSSSFEFFNTFNILFENQKNIVLTSDTTPENIKDMEERLKSRFASGLVVQISPPDVDICCAILERYAENDGIAMPKDVINFVAQHIHKNIRILEGAYNSIKAYCQLRHCEITLDVVKEALKGNNYIQDTRELTMDLIIDTVCSQYNVPKSKLLGKSRPKNIVIPRQIAMYLCRTDLNEPYQSIADIFHKNDHTSVLQACRRVEKQLDSDPTMKKTIESLRELLKKP